MTEEEIEAIEQFKSWRDYIIKHIETTENATDLEFYIRTILDLMNLGIALYINLDRLLKDDKGEEE